LILAAALPFFITCGLPGDLPSLRPAIPDKGFYYIDGIGEERYRNIEMICYVDVSKYNPLNALDYTLQDSGTQFFDFVILGEAFVKRGAYSAYLSVPDYLEKFLKRRGDFIKPLQKKGIRVLLRISGNESISIGNLNEEEGRTFANYLYDFLLLYGLDGVEFNDEGADPFSYPRESEYDPFNGEGPEDPDGNPTNLSMEEWLLKQWKIGGDNLNNAAYLLRYRGVPERGEGENTVSIIMRHTGFARYLPSYVTCEEGWAAFVGANVSYKYFINPNSKEYGVGGVVYEQNGVMPLWEELYCPFVIELDGGPGENVYRVLEASESEDMIDHEMLEYTIDFRDDNDYHAIYWHNLKPVSEADDDDFYDYPWFVESEPETEFALNGQGDFAVNYDNPRRIPLPGLIDMVSLKLFKERVVCSGGDRLKQW
jgi:hypothetical protein